LIRHGRHLRLGRDVAIFVLLVVLSAGIMTLERLAGNNPIGGQVARIFIPFERLSSAVMNLSLIRKENRLLRAKVMDVARENALLREQARENERLRNLLDFEAAYPGTLCACRVVRELGQRMGGGIVLDKGRSSGLERNMTVIAPEGLVGRIISVSRDVCLVKRLIDPGYRVSALTQRTRATGILGTHTVGTTVMEWVSPNAEVAVGDTVITSGLGSVTPKGIMLGSIVRIQEKPERFSRTLDVAPFVDFGSLEEAFVILEKPPDYGAFFEEGEA
jgi:rod shape-determining protein MreC